MNMNDLPQHLTHGADFEVVEDSQFFAPVPADVFDSLLGQYQALRRDAQTLSEFMTGGALRNVVHYFIEGNCGDDHLHRSLYVDKMFAMDGAIGSLNSAFWSKALNLTDVYAMMPQERKNEWNKQLRHPLGVPKKHHSYEREEAIKAGRALPEWESAPLPHFEPETVRATILGLLNARAQFLAERVDGIFRALSGHHVTNAPEAFGKRMIVAHMLSAYSTTDHTRVGYLHDLRCVIAKFMGRDEPLHLGPTDALVRQAKERRGEWVTADGGALRIRVYKVGTAHLEVHPDMAYRLNQILAFMHPHSIPSEFRQKPKRRSKEFALMGRPMPFVVLGLLAGLRVARERIPGVPGDWRERTREIPNTRSFDHGDHDKAAMAEAVRVLESIGGVKTGHHFTFEYDPAEAMAHIVCTGCIPDDKAHQFYPTPEKLARLATEAAEIGDESTVLEPSAGNGDLAAFLPAARTTCVEVSALRCAVLKARGLSTVQADFIEWAASTSQRFDRVVANPPFSEGRWQAHTEAAASLVRDGGRLVVILPASARNGFTLAGFECAWSGMYSNEFPGTSAAVVILTAQRR